MSCVPYSVGLRRRWPCWPGPYSRSLNGLLGRPHRFTWRRRSILYLDSARFVTLSNSVLTVVVSVPSVRPGRIRRRGLCRGPQLGSGAHHSQRRLAVKQGKVSQFQSLSAYSAGRFLGFSRNRERSLTMPCSV